jgi:long-chain fatty acid transport protein
MKLKTLSTAILLATVPMTGVFAAAMDRSGQSIAAFLQPGNYFEAGISALDADVSGKETGELETRRTIEDMADSYYFPNAALKLQLTDKFSFGLLYDQPFGANATYTGENAFVSESTDQILAPSSIANITQSSVSQLVQAAGASFAPTLAAVTAAAPVGTPQQTLILGALQRIAATNPTVAGGLQQLQGTQTALTNANAALGEGSTEVEVHTQNLSFIFGYQPTENWNIYAGPVYQTVKGDLKLRGQAYSIFNGYDANFKETGDLGWLAGAAFQIPEIALKASVTYRSEIEHEADTRENISVLDNNPVAGASVRGLLTGLGVPGAYLDATSQPGNTKITTPQSVNLDLQSGIMANTVAFLNVRWVDWSEFSIRPYRFGKLSEAVGQLDSVNRENGFDLVKYDKDQWSATAGVGRKFSEQWAGNVSVGWDSGAGNPITTLGPTEGYWNLGLGLQFSPTPATFIAGGVKYFWLGDAESQTAAQVGEDNRLVGDFSDNHAIAYGLKMGYRF